jgi:hypothetical protein
MTFTPRPPRGSRSSYGPRVDEHTGALHMRVPDAIKYERERVTTLWSRKVGNGTLRCELLRGDKPSRRLVQLVADYEERGNGQLRTCICTDELDEARQVARLEKLMLEAAILPTLEKGSFPIEIPIERDESEGAGPGLQDDQ